MPAQRNYPRRTLEQALRVPMAIKENNGGNPWKSVEVAAALGVGANSGNFWYITAASRDYGLTQGTRDTTLISLTPLGRRAVYPASAQDEHQAKVTAFLSVALFKRVLEHFGGNNLPERRFLTNILRETFSIDESLHDEFLDLFVKNCRFLGIGEQFSASASSASRQSQSPETASGGETVTVATPESGGDAPVCFVIMPFTERQDEHQTGFFEEALTQLFTPAAADAGFQVRTARRQGSDVIQSTIVNDLLEADLVLADLTEHNPNVLFELGLRIMAEKPVALVKARGTGPIFDIDNMLRIAEYSPNLWPSTVDQDVPTIREHIQGAWDNRESDRTYMEILRRH